MKVELILTLVAVFALGWIASGMQSNVEVPFDFFGANDQISPSNHIKKDQIHVYNDRIVIDLPNAQWAEFTDTNSMDPVLDIEANSFEVKPSSESNISVGDIISYKPSNFPGLIVHRVVEIDSDEDGWYAIMKGDNLTFQDPERVRFEQIEGVLVGIIY